MKGSIFRSQHWSPKQLYNLSLGSNSFYYSYRITYCIFLRISFRLKNIHMQIEYRSFYLNYRDKFRLAIIRQMLEFVNIIYRIEFRDLSPKIANLGRVYKMTTIIIYFTSIYFLYLNFIL